MAGQSRPPAAASQLLNLRRLRRRSSPYLAGRRSDRRLLQVPTDHIPGGQAEQAFWLSPDRGVTDQKRGHFPGEGPTDLIPADQSVFGGNKVCRAGIRSVGNLELFRGQLQVRDCLLPRPATSATTRGWLQSRWPLFRPNSMVKRSLKSEAEQSS